MSVKSAFSVCICNYNNWYILWITGFPQISRTVCWYCRLNVWNMSRWTCLHIGSNVVSISLNCQNKYTTVRISSYVSVFSHIFIYSLAYSTSISRDVWHWGLRWWHVWFIISFMWHTIITVLGLLKGYFAFFFQRSLTCIKIWNADGFFCLKRVSPITAINSTIWGLNRIRSFIVLLHNDSWFPRFIILLNFCRFTYNERF